MTWLEPPDWSIRKIPRKIGKCSRASNHLIFCGVSLKFSFRYRTYYTRPLGRFRVKEKNIDDLKLKGNYTRGSPLPLYKLLQRGTRKKDKKNVIIAIKNFGNLVSDFEFFFLRFSEAKKHHLGPRVFQQVLHPAGRYLLVFPVNGVPHKRVKYFQNRG